MLRIALFFAALFAVHPAVAELPKSFVYSIFQVHLKPPGSGDYKPEGTAFLIDKRGYFLTASHLFRLEPEEDPYDGDIRLVLGGYKPSASNITIDGAKEIFHQTSKEMPDISILKAEILSTSDIIFEFDLAVTDEHFGQLLEILGYPIGKSGVWEWVPPLAVSGIPNAEFSMLVSTTGGVKPGHSGSPLFLRDDGITFGVTYGTVDFMTSWYKKECGSAAYSSNDFCSDEFYGYLQSAELNNAILFTHLDAFSPPFTISRVIPPTERIRDLIRELDQLSNSPSSIRRRLHEPFLGEPLTALEAGSLLIHLVEKGAGYLLDNSARMYSMTMVSREFHQKRRASIIDRYLNLIEGQ